MKILGNILALVRGLLILLSMFIYLVFYAISRIVFKHTKESGLRLRCHWIKYMVFPILNLKVEVKGKPIKEAALYVGNHRSFTDPIIKSKYVNAFVIAKAEVANYPLINKGAEVTGVIYVKREDKSSRNNARKEFLNVIQEGHNILVYPEGTISTTKHTLPFKKGTFHEVAREGFSVIPVALEYKSDKDLWKIPNLVSQYLSQFGKWSTQAKMSFGPVMTSKDGEELTKMCHEWINKELEEMQEGWSEMKFTEE